MPDEPTSQIPARVLPQKISDGALRLFAERGTDRVSVSDLAHAAGVTRATIYNHCADPAEIFSLVARQLADDLHRVIAAANRQEGDPAARLAAGIGHFLRRAHEQPDWGRFILRFALTTESLRSMVLGQPAHDINEGIEQGRFFVEAAQIPGLLAMIGGAVLSQIALILAGHSPWRGAAADLSEFVLRALGVAPDEARAIARRDLPDLWA